MVKLKDVLGFVLVVMALAGCNRLDDSVVLNAPEDIRIERTSIDGLTITWNNTSTSYDGVMIERAEPASGVEFRELARVVSGVHVYTDSDDLHDGAYQYRLTTYRSSQMSAPATAKYHFTKLPAPTEFKCVLVDEGLLLTWKDNCIGEEGYVVRKMDDGISFSDWKTMAADATSVVDTEIVSGLYEYEIYAFAGEDRSAVVSLKLDNTGVPQIKTGNAAASWHQVSIPFTLVDDGGYPCEAGVCWKDDGGKGANTSDNCYTYPVKLRTGDLYYGSVQGLVPGKKYHIRPWVRYEGQYQYYSEIVAELLPEPEAYSVNWNNVSGKYGMPKSIRLYNTTTDVTGRTITVWYAVADMSAGDLEFRTVMRPAPSKPSEVAASLDGVQLLINGGFFEGDKSLSYIMDRGDELSRGVQSLKCTYYADENMTPADRTYHVTRGAFGVNHDQEPSVKWLYGSKDWAYDTPIANYISGPAFKPSTTTPSAKLTWNVQSAIGGGPVILRDDHMCFDYLSVKDKGSASRRVGNYELLGDDVFGPSVRTARTAVGHTADGKIVFMVVECGAASEGATLDELARLMKSAGCTDALNLGGGGSTVMCAGRNAEVLTSTEPEALTFVALVSI